MLRRLMFLIIFPKERRKVYCRLLSTCIEDPKITALPQKTTSSIQLENSAKNIAFSFSIIISQLFNFVKRKIQNNYNFFTKLLQILPKGQNTRGRLCCPRQTSVCNFLCSLWHINVVCDKLIYKKQKLWYYKGIRNNVVKRE